jgi:acylphosphatase
MKIRAHVFVTGRVQGIFFRSETQEKANRQGVTGWVRNLPDGGVEAVLEGEKENVEKIVEFCKRGSPAAKVIKVDVQWLNFTGEFKDFRIKYGNSY